VDVESAVLIGLLATALFSTIGLLATALFQLRGRIDALGSEIADVRRDIAGIRADLARIEARLDAHLQEAHG
jgi:outer membrane murein-binding lipoprotein Lpp